METMNTKDPIAALENGDDRTRREIAKATRLVAKELNGEKLRRFAQELAALMRRFLPTPAETEPGHGGAKSPKA